MFQTGETIKKTLDEIYRHDLVLPAIQREFVWQPEQICRLFDSLMQGYPFGTFLYWRVDPENSGKFKFFDFVREYHQRDNPHCPPLPEMPNQRLTAVLDGQQRLTALNIGLRGSMARKLPRKWWNSPGAFPTRRLCLDLLWQPDEDDEEGLKYRFSFLTDRESNECIEGVCWFPVGQVLSLPNAGPAMTQWLNDRLPQEQVTLAHETLYELYQVVHNKHLIAYYEEKGQELDKALQIFIRMNDGGTPLSHSDLLLSIAVAQWTDHDARQEIHDLVDELNSTGAGFNFSKDLVLKAGLMLSDIGSVGFKVDNFNSENMEIFESNWEKIRRALILTVRLVESFGFTDRSLTAHSAILPITYYLFKKNPGETFLTHRSFESDRKEIREWLIRSLLKSGIWGSGLDTLLTGLRRIIGESDIRGFPVASIREEMARSGRELDFNDEEVEELADMRYGNRLTFALLSLLFPFVNLRNQFHVDHIFPSARFTERRLRDACVAEDEIECFRARKDGLANLQLLQGAVNTEKNATMPAEWLSSTHMDNTSRRAYEDRHLLGDVPESITEFVTFYDARRERLKERVKELLGYSRQNTSTDQPDR
ncbi:MAG: DUF262 domain-containing protein [Caldilineaceae bacterium]|nr:DUF262 domain-containing protein [Caldilineaceae bacterium]